MAFFQGFVETESRLNLRLEISFLHVFFLILNLCFFLPNFVIILFLYSRYEGLWINEFLRQPEHVF